MAFLIGSIIPAFLISRLILFIGNKIYKKQFYITSNSISLLISGTMFAFGKSDVYPNLFPAILYGITLYALPQFFCLAYDFYMFQKPATDKNAK